MEYGKLPNGAKIPALGLGVWEMRGEETSRAVGTALRLGYRMIDTAAYYGNETEVGAGIRSAIADGVLRRDELFVSTKVWYTDMEPGRVRPAFEASLEKLGLDYVDLYLLHWPLGDVAYAWKELERFHEEGLAKAIGVCNFRAHHFEELALTANVRPMLDQIETHPTFAQQAVVDYCDAHGIRVEAWGPLGKGRDLREETVADIARRHGKTPAQVVLRWNLQRGVIVIPKSVHEERLTENAGIFDFSLDETEMRALSALDTNETQRSYMPGYRWEG